MNICDSCRGESGKVVDAFNNVTQFLVTTSAMPDAKPDAKSDPVNLCHACQKQLNSVVNNIGWVIRERGIEHLLKYLRNARTDKVEAKTV